MSHPRHPDPDPLRRRLLLAAPALGFSAPGALLAQTASRPAQVGEVRLALLLGNRTYVKDYNLPPIPKNLRDLRGALESCGFKVTDALDLDLVQSQGAVATFSQLVRAAPADATIFFYFCGHGMQDDEAKNLLVSAGVNVAEVSAVKKGSLKLDSDVVNPLAPRSAGATFAVIDACRVSVFNQARGEKGLNQVEAPPGCLIAFSTAAGKPALAPSVDTQNTFYTASLVKLIATVTEETTFADLFRLVKRDVRQTMLAHPVQAVRNLAQDPFIADYTHASVYVLPRRQQVAGGGGGGAPARASAPDEDTAWQRIQQSIWPPEVAQLGEAFLRSYPASKFAPSVEIARDGASDAARILRRDDIKLFRSAFKPREDLGAQYQEDLTRAARGDKDAAARVAKVYRTDESRGPTLGRYEGWLQYAAALGNGIASYDLALLYRTLGQPDPSARFEARALELGYTPPPTLSGTRK